MCACVCVLHVLRVLCVHCVSAPKTTLAWPPQLQGLGHGLRRPPSQQVSVARAVWWLSVTWSPRGVGQTTLAKAVDGVCSFEP